MIILYALGVWLAGSIPFAFYAGHMLAKISDDYPLVSDDYPTVGEDSE